MIDLWLNINLNDDTLACVDQTDHSNNERLYDYKTYHFPDKPLSCFHTPNKYVKSLLNIGNLSLINDLISLIL